MHAKLGVVAVLAYCPENAFMMKTSLFGTYGQITSWAAEIQPDVLTDCKKCFCMLDLPVQTDEPIGTTDRSV